MLRIDVLTLFPEMFEGVFHTSMLKRAQQKLAVQLHTINFREFAQDKHQIVDDTPYGGGAGMVLKPEPIVYAVEDLEQRVHSNKRFLLMSPQGVTFNQQLAEQYAQEEHLVLICGHYEGIDERVKQILQVEEVSIGDYVLTGGELPAMVIIDSVVRLLPGVLGNEQSAQSDSFTTGLLEYPQYTRPVSFRGYEVPEVLRSGNHALIDAWRRRQSLYRTWKRRPDLLRQLSLTDEEKDWIKQFENERGI